MINLPAGTYARSPLEFLRRLGESLPPDVRPIKQVPKDRKQKWLDLADSLARRHPTESSQRTVRFLIEIATQPLEGTVDQLLPLKWLERDEETPEIDISAPSFLRTFCPAMRFRATLR